jgi:hypothetical protein
MFNWQMRRVVVPIIAIGAICISGIVSERAFAQKKVSDPCHGSIDGQVCHRDQKSAKPKVGDREVIGKDTSDRKATGRKAAQRKGRGAGNRKVANKKAGKRKVAGRVAGNRKAAKRKIANKRAGNRKAGKRKSGNRKGVGDVSQVEYPPTPVNIAMASYGVIHPGVPGGPSGLIVLKQKGNTLRANLVVTGLIPNTVHAAHLHGPRGGCKAGKFTNRHAAEFADLRSNEQGVATQTITVKVREQILGQPGYFVMIHQNPTISAHKCCSHHKPKGLEPIPTTNPPGPANPSIGCGDIQALS